MKNSTQINKVTNFEGYWFICAKCGRKIKHAYKVNNSKDVYHEYKGIQQKQGVYFLIKKDIIVYVGMSRWNIKERINQHINKDFDTAKYIENNEISIFFRS
jgi:hypothetical protein